MDIRDAYQAIDYLDISARTYAQMFGKGLYPVFISIESIDDYNIAEAGVEANALLFDVYYALILNGEYREEEVYDTGFREYLDASKDNLFIKLVMYCSRVEMEVFHIENQIQGREEFEQEYKTIAIRFGKIYSRVYCLCYLFSKRYDNSIFDSDIFSYDNTEESLLQLADYAVLAHDYSILESVYYDLVKINFYNCFIENDEDSMNRFESYFSIWQNVSGQESLSVRNLDKDFGGITRGVLLDYYIAEVNNLLSKMVLEDNPSFFCYTQWDLGKHYYYKAQELILLNSSSEEIEENLRNALRCLYLASLFFSEETNVNAYNEINLYISEIDELLNLY